jgi:SAM-dependent methyltransferase
MSGEPAPRAAKAVWPELTSADAAVDGVAAAPTSTTVAPAVLQGPEVEPAALAQRYARRLQNTPPGRYSLLQADVWQSAQERQRELVQLLRRNGISDLAPLRLVEVGCGSGGNLLELLRLGFVPENLQGLELLPERLQQARQRLPAAVRLWGGDARLAPVPEASLDLVLQSTVFSSLLDDTFQQQLAQALWRWLKPGGAVIWYDFTFDNPRNADVRGVPLARVRALFPGAVVQHRRVTLAPPLARAVCALHPSLYVVLNALPLLRTHVLAWVQKPAVVAGG